MKYKVILALTCLFCCASSCPTPTDHLHRYERDSYIASYHEPESVDAVVSTVHTPAGEAYYQIEVVAYNSAEVAGLSVNEELFSSLCKENKDEWFRQSDFYDRFVTDYTQCFADNYTVDVYSVSQWDESHPAQSSLNDLIWVTGVSFYPFVQSGYVPYDYLAAKQSSLYDMQHTGLMTYYPIDKPLTDLEPDDLRMCPLSFSRLKKAPRGVFYIHNICYLYLPKQENTSGEALVVISTASGKEYQKTVLLE